MLLGNTLSWAPDFNYPDKCIQNVKKTVIEVKNSNRCSVKCELRSVQTHFETASYAYEYRMHKLTQVEFSDTFFQQELNFREGYASLGISMLPD